MLRLVDPWRSCIRRRRARALPQLAAAASLVALLLAGRAWAEPSADDRALATALFEEGRVLMSNGRTDLACSKFEESHRLDPSGGTILNLALCDEQRGLLARSWSEFYEAISFAGRDGRSDREEVAKSHIRALEPRLSRLTIVVPESARVDGLRIERDGRELGQPSWSTPMPVDGGEHVVRAMAPGKLPFSTTIVISNESDTRTVEVPPLAAAPVAPPAAAVTSVPAGVSLAVPAPEPPSEDGARGGMTRRRIAWAIGAAGLAQWGVAGYFGLQAFRKHADSNSACPGEQCSTLGVTLNDESRVAADTSTVLAVTGLCTVATSVYLLLTSRKGSEGAPPAQPPRYSFGGTRSTILLQGRF
jgi:hypothetical protein